MLTQFDENRTLARAVTAAKSRGLMGVVVFDQGECADGFRYVAACVGRDGRICDPRNFNPQQSPEAAIIDLVGRLERPAA